MKAVIKNGEEWVPCAVERRDDQVFLSYLEKTLTGKVLNWSPPDFSVEIAGETFQGLFYRDGDFLDIHLPQGTFRVRYGTSGQAAQRGHAPPGELTAPMPGKVLKVLVQTGQAVKKGEPLLILEAMKMEHPIPSPLDGKVTKILFKEGDRVSQDEELIEVVG